MPKIYLDYAAATPIDPKVLKTMMPYLKKEFGNASSIHAFGQRALSAIEDARNIVANFLRCQPEEVYFTGSATEADNLAIQGIVKAAKSRIAKPHIITSAIEHHAVLEPCQYLKKQGCEVTVLPVSKDGLVSLADLKKAVQENTVLVSVIYANNEIGAIQPLAEIGKFLKQSKTKIYFHTDAVQAVNYLDCNVDSLGVDLLTISAHKIYGPKGVGALYVRKGTAIEPMVYGGGHERGLRPGTENVAGIVGLGAAIKEVASPKNKIHNIRIRQLRDKLIKKIPKIISDIAINGSLEKRLPNNINFTFPGAEGEALLVALDQKGFAVSTGSACSSHSLEASHVLTALGLPEETAHSSLRITLGKYTNEKEIDIFVLALAKVVERLREISGYKTKTNGK
ncbi:MAG: cysteine desulfurase [Candidatus Nealsonbacteria bacterium]|nr:cysteine desulfurase [Candidatus Nealsonbacteria bacterium]